VKTKKHAASKTLLNWECEKGVWDDGSTQHEDMDVFDWVQRRATKR